MRRIDHACRRAIVGTVLALAAVGHFATMPAAQAADQKPNFIVINIDDLGYADIGPFGATKQKTPNLDRMAAEGRKLMSHYAAPVCSPSRAALMTGCYPKRVLPIPGVLFPAGAVGLNPEEKTVAEYLKDLGYATACFGKWHLGDQPEFMPTSQGFDTYYGIPFSNDMGPGSEGSKSNFGEKLPKPKAATPDESEGEVGLRGNAQPPLPLVENLKTVERVGPAEQATVTRRYTERAVKFIDDHKAKPFFIYLPHNAVHFPIYPDAPFRGRSQGGLRGDWIEEVDWSVGQVLDAVRKAGISERTLVIFTSDNGGPTNQQANNAPYRGGKGSTLEGGIRVCTIAWWPGKIAAGTATMEMTSMMDVLPTLVSLAGGKVSADRKLDGLDVSQVLTGPADARSPRQEFCYFRGPKLEAVRKGPWKLHLADGALYNVVDDPGEATNVVSAHPSEVEQLQAVAVAMAADLGDKNDSGPGVRKLGRVDNPQPWISHDGKFRELDP
ncbi:MAG: sulfatase [Planctomycetales bacterium]|nr:sulfatase [Planctomycetales bacterium]